VRSEALAQKAIPADAHLARFPASGKLSHPSRCRALAANAALVAHQLGQRWALSAYARSDGHQLWRVPLPGEPAYNGIAISRGGDAIVSLLDGRVVCVGAP
jgi:hypothetical protein